MTLSSSGLHISSGASTRVPLLGTPEGDRVRNSFIADVFGIAKVNRFWLPSAGDSGTNTIELSRNEGQINWQDNVTVKDISSFTKVNLGSGQAYIFDGSDDNGELSADLDVDSYGDGANDSPFSGAALVNVDAAGNASPKMIVAKHATSGREWRFFLDQNEELVINLHDESEGSFIGQFNASGTIGDGGWALVGFSYDGSRVSSGCKLWGFNDGGSIRGQLSSSSSSSGTYTAMENKGQPLQIGSRGGGGDNVFLGQIAMMVVYDADLTETQWETLAAQTGAYHGLNLT